MDVKSILEAAVRAPSGDNCQPWSLAVKDNQIRIFNLPEKDTSLYNFRQIPSLIAHGALIENILIASSALGYDAKLRTFPDDANQNLIATVELENSNAKNEPLYPCLTQRSTNRKPYKPILLTSEEKSNLLNTSGYLTNGSVRLLEESREKELVAEALGINDRLVFENQKLHRFLFEHIRWTEREAQKTRDGLYIRTLELPLPQIIGFRLLRHWNVANALNKFGLSRFIAKQGEKLALSSSAIGLITVPNNTDADFLSGGRLMQRVWLETARIGLSLQPMTGITFLIQKILAGESKGLSSGNIKLIKDAHEKIRAAFKIRDETTVMLFRVGHSGPPSARSLRLPLETVVRNA